MTKTNTANTASM